MLPDTTAGPNRIEGQRDEKSQLPGVLTPILAQFDLELEAVEVIPAGKRQLLRVVVDGDGPDGTGPLLDDLAEASKALSAALDSSDAVGSAAYTLEVSTRGIGRPLDAPRHWRRNRGRLVAVTPRRRQRHRTDRCPQTRTASARRRRHRAVARVPT